MITKRNIFKICFILLFMIVSMSSCKTSESISLDKEKEAERIKAEKLHKDEYKKEVTAHYNRQTPKTKERMKRTKERSEYYNRKKRLTFFERLFGKKKHKTPKKKKRNQ